MLRGMAKAVTLLWQRGTRAEPWAACSQTEQDASIAGARVRTEGDKRFPEEQGCRRASPDTRGCGWALPACLDGGGFF